MIVKNFALRRPLLFSALLLAIAYSLMGVWRLSAQGPGFEGSESYSRIADFVLQNGYFENTFRPPLYPLFLASLMVVFQSAWISAAVILQGAVALCLGLVLVRSSLRLSGSPVAAFFSLSLFISNILFQFEVMAKRETALFTLALLCFFVAALFIERLQQRYLVMMLSFVISFLLRPNAIVLIPIFAIFAFFDRRRADFSVKLFVVPIVLFFILLIPWQMFVYQQSGKFPITTSTNSGQTLWKGNNPYLFQVWPHGDIDLIEPEMARGIGVTDITTPDADNKLKAQAIEYIKADPLRALKNAVLKGIFFFAPFPVPLGSGKLTIEAGIATFENYRYRNPLILAFATLQALVVWFGFIGFLRNAKTSSVKFQLAIISVVFVLSLLAVHVLTYPESRYRWPLDILLILLSSDFYASWYQNRSNSAISAE